MTDWIDEKAFKLLWRSLTKAGWRARPSTGLNSGHTYVKPGVKGQLQEDRAGVEYFVGPKALWTFATREGLIPPLSSPPRSFANTGRPPMGKQAAYAAAQKRLPPVPPIFNSTTSAVTAPTEQGGGVNVTNAVDLDAFDSPPAHALVSQEEAESVSDPVEAPVDLSDSYESEVELDNEFEDDSSEFAQDDAAMRAMASSGWEIYDQNHSSDLQLAGASDLYDGSWGLTRSSAAFASSPLGMFFYFLPKKLWYQIAEASEAYRIECIPSVAAAQRAKQLEAHTKDRTKPVLPLEVLVDKLKKTRSIKPHEILHVVGLLIVQSHIRP
ncbi:hypothetical protein PPTG_23639 [Phytophthora nicotianae INRA-310]|uniref:Uncharacterized protein n=1 Tax=Phytophthora nicotianae (strain INRA-310) TaxID=761204 RepID=W2PVE6_PHYN3|nr:hypothetical protein PPTG_23639 [Phytophthora nicotianae INRA-310]ETN04199.1 hypothetical protein PPTG_23639 [Phytophthora nicotianae INRA-310]